MKKLKQIISLSILAFVLMSATCNNKDTLTFEENPNFKVYNLSAQKEIPGQEHEKIFERIEFFVDQLPENLTLDSIYYKEVKGLKLSHSTNRYNAKYFKGSSKNKFEHSEMPTGDGIVLFYSEKTKQYFTIVKNLIIKDELIRP